MLFIISWKFFLKSAYSFAHKVLCLARPVHLENLRWLGAVVHDNVQAVQHVLTHPRVLAAAGGGDGGESRIQGGEMFYNGGRRGSAK